MDALDTPGVADRSRRDDLEGHAGAGRFVERAIDGAESSLPKESFEPIALSDLRAGRDRAGSFHERRIARLFRQ